MKKILAFAAFCYISLALMACGDDVSQANEQESVQLFDSTENFPDCSDKNQGEMVMSKKDNKLYYCVDTSWVQKIAEDSVGVNDENGKEDKPGADGADDKNGKDSSETVIGSNGADDKDSIANVKKDSVTQVSGDNQNLAVKNKSISGVSQKGPFVNGGSVTVKELDGKTLAQTGKSFKGNITSEKGEFSVSGISLASQYALLEANGFYKNEVTGEKSNTPITLNALTDLSDRERVNINLLTHLEYGRAMYLVEKGKTLTEAKKQAESEILKAFGFEGEFKNSEDLSIFASGEGNAALLAMSVLMQGDLSEASLLERLAYFASDIKKDGKWDDVTTATKMADWASDKNLSQIRSNIENWNLGTVPDFEKFVTAFWHNNYGLGECSEKRSGEVLAVANELSQKYDTETRYICKENAWEIATDDETDSQLDDGCTEKREGEKVLSEIDGITYYCHKKTWYSLNDWSWDIPKEAWQNSGINYGSMTDSRDGQVYKTIVIGKQTWMAENLNYETADGKSSCYNNIESRCNVTGRLYTWAAAMDSVNQGGCGDYTVCTPNTPHHQGVCPKGWHLPRVDEWIALREYIAIATGQEIEEAKVGLYLKTQVGWYNSGNGNDAYGFSALPSAGFYDLNEDYAGNIGACYWSSTGNTISKAYSASLYFSSDDFASKNTTNKDNVYAVRCLKDSN